MDWHEGFQIYGENGSVIGKTYNPWYYKTSDVEIFHESDGTTRRVLGADGHFYRRQLEGFADTILHGAPMRGADIEDGIASVRAMVAIARSVESGKRSRSPTCRARSDAARHLREDVRRQRPLTVLAAAKAAGYATVQYNMACSGLPSLPDVIPRMSRRGGRPPRRRAGVAIAAVSGDLQHDPPRSGGARRRAREPRAIAGAAHRMGTRLLTLCTGTRDPDDQWRRHRTTTRRGLARPSREHGGRDRRSRSAHDVDLGIEPERANVIDSAAKARRLLDDDERARG